MIFMVSGLVYVALMFGIGHYLTIRKAKSSTKAEATRLGNIQMTVIVVLMLISTLWFLCGEPGVEAALRSRYGTGFSL